MSLCYSKGYNQPLDVGVIRTFSSVVFLEGDISNAEGNLEQACGFEQRCTELAEWVYKTMQEMSTKPALWIHAWRHLMAASEEERKMNVDRAKRAFTDNTLFAPTHHGTVPETAATCEDSMAPEDDHPEVELLHEGETEEAEADGDVEDIVIEVPVQQLPKRSSQHSSDALRSTSSAARARAVVSSRNRRLELTRETACLNFYSCLIHIARPGATV